VRERIKGVVSVRVHRRTPPPPRRHARLSKSNAASSMQRAFRRIGEVKGLGGGNRRSKAVLTYALIPASLANTAELWVKYSKCCPSRCSSLAIPILNFRSSLSPKLSASEALGADSLGGRRSCLTIRFGDKSCGRITMVVQQFARLHRNNGIENDFGSAAPKENRDPIPHPDSAPVAPRAPKSI
jgi:hypothetical protein